MTPKEAIIYLSKCCKSLGLEYGEKINDKDREALETIKNVIEENEKLKQKIKEKNDIIFDLEQKLNTEESDYVFIVEKFVKHRQAIVILKNLFFIDLIENENGSYKLGFAPIEPIDNTRFTEIFGETAKHIKEIFKLC